MRTAADKGEGGQKLAKSCGHLLCMTPNTDNIVLLLVAPLPAQVGVYAA